MDIQTTFTLKFKVEDREYVFNIKAKDEKTAITTLIADLEMIKVEASSTKTK